jgi:hypothetical protein
MIDSDGRGIEEVLEIAKGLVGALAKASVLDTASVLALASA